MTDGDAGVGGRDENVGPDTGSEGRDASGGAAGADGGGRARPDGGTRARPDGGTRARPDGGTRARPDADDTGMPDGGRGERSSDDGSGLSRRWVLAAVAGGTAFSSPVIGAGADEQADDDPALHVRVYPGPTPIQARLRQGGGLASGWTDAHADALAAVEDALEQVATYAAAEASLGELDVTVERRRPVGGWYPGAVSPLDAITGADDVYDDFRRRVRERDLVTGDCVHLLLWWDATNYALGYGGTRPGTAHVAAGSEEGAHTVANVGATEAWDSRAVTRNMAIHETLHAVLDDEVVADVIGSRCDHHLGTAVATSSGTREVSPMATAYAGPDEVGGSTRWHGTGCYNHDSFYRHDGTTGVSRWEYTTELSEATLEAVTRYIRRHDLG